MPSRHKAQGTTKYDEERKITSLRKMFSKGINTQRWADNHTCMYKDEEGTRRTWAAEEAAKRGRRHDDGHAVHHIGVRKDTLALVRQRNVDVDETAFSFLSFFLFFSFPYDSSSPRDHSTSLSVKAPRVCQCQHDHTIIASVQTPGGGRQ
jgi:hypothetical protein